MTFIYILLLCINILYTEVKCAIICWFTNAIYIQDFYSSELKLPMLIWLYHVLNSYRFKCNSYNLIYSSNGRWRPSSKSTGLWATRSGCHIYIYIYIAFSHVTPVKVCCCRGLAFWGKKHRPAPRQRKWHDMYLKGNLDKVMCEQSYNIKLCHIERGHIFMIHCQTILQIVKCPVQLRGKISLFGETQTCSCVFHTTKVSTIFS